MHLEPCTLLLDEAPAGTALLVGLIQQAPELDL